MIPPTNSELTAAMEKMRIPYISAGGRPVLQLAGVILGNDATKEMLSRIAAAVTRDASVPASSVIFSVVIGAFTAGMHAQLLVTEARAMEESRWNHAICLGCWTREFPDRAFTRLVQAIAEPRTCCWCRAITREGIGIRIEPNQVGCKGHGHGVQTTTQVDAT